MSSIQFVHASLASWARSLLHHNFNDDSHGARCDIDQRAFTNGLLSSSELLA
jgi:hypothetical protein